MVHTLKINYAIKFGQKAHEGQLDDDGKDYFSTHCMQVFRILSQITQNSNILIAGLLHDIIEDTELTHHNIVEYFGLDVADLVMEVTHEGEKDEYGFYFPRLHSKEAIMIKFADRLSNLERMSNWKEDRQEQYLKKSKFWKSEDKHE